MKRTSVMERLRLRALSFSVDEEHLQRFQPYLASLGLVPASQRNLCRAMRHFAKYYTATGKKAYAEYVSSLQPMESAISTFTSAYHHYQRMCESGHQPSDQDLLIVSAPSDPTTDFWEPFHLKPGHPARVLCKQLFEGKALKKIHFRQTAPNEWRFESDEILYCVRFDPGKCTLTAHSKVTGSRQMHRMYSIHPDGTLEEQ